MLNRFELVVFDIGGVLVKTVQSFEEAHQHAGLPFPPPSGPKFEARRAALPRRGTGAIDSEKYYPLFADASQGIYTAGDVRRISEASLIEEYPGIGSVFDAIEAVSVETAVLGNTNDAHWASFFAQTPEEPKFPTLASTITSSARPATSLTESSFSTIGKRTSKAPARSVGPQS